MPNKTTSSVVIPTGTTFNRILEAADRVLSGSGFAAGGMFSDKAVTITVQNKTTVDYSAFEIIPLGDLQFTDDEDYNGLYRNPLVHSKTSAISQDDFGRWGITLHPMPADSIAEVAVAGITACTVNVGNVDHLFADIFASDKTELDSATTGSARLLGKPTVTGVQKCLVQLGVAAGGLLWGSLNADLAAGTGTSTISTPTATVHGDWITTASEIVSGSEVCAIPVPAGGGGIEWMVITSDTCESVA